MLDKIFRRSDAIDREALCIIAGERVSIPFEISRSTPFPYPFPSLPSPEPKNLPFKIQVWHLRIAVHALADAGSILDCASLACAAALRHFRRPDVEVLGARDVIVHAPDSRAPVPLALHHTPFCVSFAFYRAAASEPQSSKKGGGAAVAAAPRILLDPAGLEQRLAQGTLNLALTPQRELAVVHKAGGLPLAPEVLMGAVQVAARRAKELEAWLDVRVREDWIRKKVEVR
jgi:exosome complex component RRP45